MDTLAHAVTSEHLHLQLPSRPELIEKTALRLTERAKQSGVCTEERQCALATSLTEAITNAIIHGNLEISSDLKELPGNAFGEMVAHRCTDPRYVNRMVDIRVDDDGHQCTWTITDQGQGFNVEKFLQKLDTEEPQTELASGRGILMIRAFTDNVVWDHGGRTIRMTMARPQAHMPRKHVRKQVLQPIQLFEEHPDLRQAFDALITNASHAGAGILSPGGEQMKQLLPAGENIEGKRLLLEMQIDGKTVLIPAEVRHMQTINDQLVQIGCKFTFTPETADAAPPENNLCYQAIDKLMAANVPVADGNERRKHHRSVYTKSIQLTWKKADSAETSPMEQQPAVARDLSHTGISFIAPFALAKGQLVEMTLEAQTEKPLHITARIVRSNRLSGKFFDHGATFILQ